MIWQNYPPFIKIRKFLLSLISYERRAWNFSNLFSKILNITIGREAFWQDIPSVSNRTSLNYSIFFSGGCEEQLKIVYFLAFFSCIY